MYQGCPLVFMPLLRYLNKEDGEMAERTKAAALKAADPRKRVRGFESHSLRHNTYFHTSYIAYP